MDKEYNGTPALKPVQKILRSRFLRKSIPGIILGGLAGFLFYYFIGCNSGTCAITSNPWNSTIMGSLMGFLITV